MEPKKMEISSIFMLSSSRPKASVYFDLDDGEHVCADLEMESTFFKKCVEAFVENKTLEIDADIKYAADVEPVERPIFRKVKIDGE